MKSPLKSKNTGKISSQNVPLWLRRLKVVKQELRGTRWPSEEDGFKQALSLMNEGWSLLKQEAETQLNTRKPHLVERQIHEWLVAFSKADDCWIHRWRKERGRFFSG